METVLTLCGRGNRSRFNTNYSFTLNLNLHLHRKAYDAHDMLNVVYQDMAYDYSLKGISDVVNLGKIELFINDRKIDTWFSVDDRENDLILIHPFNDMDKMPFFLLYGITNIIVHLVYVDGTEKYLFSDWIGIAVSENKVELIDSVGDMLDAIYKKDHSLLHKESINFKLGQRKVLERQSISIENEITLLKQVLQVLNQCLLYFIEGAHKSLEQEYILDRVEKLTVFNNRNLRYISTHPELLRPSNSSSGIYFDGQYFVPEKTLIQTRKFICENYENRIVLSFIATLLNHVKKRRIEFENSIKELSGGMNISVKLRAKYVLSSGIIDQYLYRSRSENLEAFEELYNQFSDVFIQYRRLIPCECNILVNLPQPTPIFLELYHYRSIYEMINKWFCKKSIDMPGKDCFLHFYSADTIYEYYCLLNIYDVIKELGYREDYRGQEEPKSRLSYNYLPPNPWYENTTEDNTFYFCKNEVKLTLYYTPVIYSRKSITSNGITLFRTDEANQQGYQTYYLPDFILKKESPQGISYGILDAKWRPQNILLGKSQEGGLRELSYKYIYSIVDAQTLKSVDFFWLLQGKDDGAQIYFHHNGMMSRNFDEKFRYQTGIVKVTPKTGDKDLARVLGHFLN